MPRVRKTTARLQDVRTIATAGEVVPQIRRHDSTAGGNPQRPEGIIARVLQKEGEIRRAEIAGFVHYRNSADAVHNSGACPWKSPVLRLRLW